MHTKEFDALLEMGNRLSALPPPPSPIAPGSPLLQQPAAGGHRTAMIEFLTLQAIDGHQVHVNKTAIISVSEPRIGRAAGNRQVQLRDRPGHWQVHHRDRKM